MPEHDVKCDRCGGHAFVHGLHSRKIIRLSGVQTINYKRYACHRCSNSNSGEYHTFIILPELVEMGHQKFDARVKEKVIDLRKTMTIMKTMKYMWLKYNIKIGHTTISDWCTIAEMKEVDALIAAAKLKKEVA